VSSSREMMGSSDMKLENLKTWNETKSEKQFLYLNWIEIVFLVNMDWLSTNMNDFIVLHCFVWNFSSHHGVLRIFTKLNLIQSDLIWSDPSIASDPSIQPASIAEQSKACLLLLYWCLQASFPSLYLPDLPISFFFFSWKCIPSCIQESLWLANWASFYFSIGSLYWHKLTFGSQLPYQKVSELL